MTQLYRILSKIFLLTTLMGFMFADVFMTELTDPQNSTDAGRYVELYNNGDSAVDLASEGYHVQRWTNDNPDPTSSSVKALTGTIPAGGFYIICNDAGKFSATYGGECDQDIGTGGAADSNGDDNIALGLYDGTDFTVLDMFGVAGEDGTGTGHEFEDGRAERSESNQTASDTWDASGWNIDNDSGGGDGEQYAPEGFDPGVWIGASAGGDDGGDECASGVYDCAGECDGSAVIDDCDDCDGGNAALDCNGECDGGAVVDACGECGGDSSICSVSVNFSVDMSVEGVVGDIKVRTSTVNGEYSPSDWFVMDDNGDGSFSYALSLVTGVTYGYNFNNSDGNGYESGDGLGDCGGGTYGNDRFVTPENSDISLEAVCWESCEACPEEIPGCMDESALNYDEYATVDDGSCISDWLEPENLFFSEYAEGTSNNKYLEIYNATDGDVDLSGYSLSSCSNGCDDLVSWDYPDNVTFDAETTVAAGDVYVVCHGSADDLIQAECDQTFTFLSNGDDVFALTQVGSGVVLDQIGDIGDDPGSGWDVAGVSDGTKEHTLVRKIDVTSGNNGDWNTSAGTNIDDSEWHVLSQNTWDYLGTHPHDIDGGTTGGGTGGGPGEDDCTNGLDDDGDSYIDCDDFDCDGDPACPDEICDNGIDDDGNGYVDCDDWACNGGPDGDWEIDPACSGTDGGGDGGTEPTDADNIFFSEYAEGSNNNKYLEIYNADDHDVNLSYYALSNCANGCNDGTSWDYPNEVELNSTALSPGEVYVVCNGSADAFILAECDQYHTYLSNGDDVYGLTQISTGGILDIIGTIGDDPGNGWDVAGVNDATKDHTLVRKSSVLMGNYGDWTSSAGTNVDNSEWEVHDQNTWDYLGYHDQGCNSIFGCTDETAFNYDPCAEQDDGTCIYQEEATIYDIQGSADSSPYMGYPVSTTGIVTGINYAGFYLQDAMGGSWSGIWVYAQALENFNDVLVGDEVNVTGIVEEFYGLTEIEANGLSIISSGNSLPDPIAIATGSLSEEHEGVLIKFNNVICETYINEHGEWEVNDESGTALIDDKLFSYEPVVGQNYSITGIGDFGFDVYRVQATNVDFPEGYPFAIAGEDQAVDYGDTVVLDASSSYDVGGTIIGFEWTQISGISVNIPNLDTDVITFTAPSQFAILTFALQVVDNDWNTSTDFVSVVVGEQSMYDIQYSSDQGTGVDCYPSQLTGETVNILGIVTAVKSWMDYPNFFIQDPSLSEWGGVYVYVPASDPLTIGDEVNFNAEIDEYYGVTELKNISGLQLVSSGNSPVYTSIATGDLGLSCGAGEMYEGMLVEFSALTVESIDTQYSSVYVNDGTGTAKLDDYFFSFDAGSWPDLSPGDTIELARGVVHYYFEEYVVYPRDLNDLSGLDGPDPVAASIYDIQHSSEQGDGEECFPSSMSGQTVNVSGTITAVKSFVDFPDFYIQDPSLSEWGGVYVYVSESNALMVGDEVNFNAEIDEYYGLTELKNLSGLQLVSSGNSPVSTSIATGDLGLSCGAGEMYEGMFVEFSGLTVESIDTQYSSVYVNDGTGTAKLDDYFFNFDAGSWPDLSPGDTIESARGVVHYYFGEYVVYPRDIGDFDADENICEGSGDANGDGNVNVVDIVIIVSFVLETSVPTADQICASDMNVDGVINVVDIVILVGQILN